MAVTPTLAPPRAASPEPYLTKRELARHYRYSIRWVESRTAAGMPSRMIGGQRRYRLSETEPWLEAASDAIGGRHA
jgi:hypothetical protein